jgi:glycosyltransferase involved in cell wall biosynthesis
LFEYACALFWQTVLTARIAWLRGFDVIHACNPPDLIFFVALPYKLFGKRFLFDHHDINPELYEAKFARRDLFYRALCFLERCTFRLADVSIATNESYRGIAIERGGMSPERVFVVRSGPSIDKMRIGPPVERWRAGKRYLVAYVGVMGSQEGIDLLLAAIRHTVFDKQRRDTHFTLVGAGTELEKLRSLTRDLGLDAYVTFTGRVSDEVLLEVLNTADVCVNPDVVNEMNDKSTMNKIMEYMAVAKPIVQFELKEGRVSAGEASLYARPNDPVDLAERILSLLDDPERRATMGKLGRARVEKDLSWQRQVPELLRAYETVFERVERAGEPGAETR